MKTNPNRCLFLSALLTFTISIQSQANAESQNSYYPFAAQKRNLVKLGGLDLFNSNIADFSNPIRDQGAIASCASFTMMALIENQLFLERGITADFSERYHLYANFMETGTMGSNSDIITQYSSIISKWGVIPESLYPYADIQKNASRFQQDAAQNLTADPSSETIDMAIKDSTIGSQRSAILQKQMFLGALPRAGYPIGLPLQVKALAKGARIPEVEDRRVPGTAKIVACYSDKKEKSQLQVSPREFVNLCLDHDPKNYFSCQPNVQSIAETLLQSSNPAEACAEIDKNTEKEASAVIAQRQSLLKLTIQLAGLGQATLAGISAPKMGGILSVWSTKLPPGGGHAVAILGDLTYQQLLDPKQHSLGILKDGTFDKLAKAYDVILKANGKLAGAVHSIDVQDNADTIFQKRTTSSIAKLMQAEGGLLFFRNSWGESKDAVQIGASGFQAMTFDYFLKNVSMVMSRRNKSLTGVTWQDGPNYCPVAEVQNASSAAGLNISETVSADIRQNVSELFKAVCKK